MKDLKKIIGLILSVKSIDEIINHLGVLIKVVGRINVLKPLEASIENIGLVIEDNIIRSVGITLSETISFKDLIDEFSNQFKWGYNHYDEETVVNFQYNEKLIIRAIIEGYIDETSLIKQSFKRFEIHIK